MEKKMETTIVVPGGLILGSGFMSSLGFRI